MTEPKYRLQLGQAKLNGKLGLEAVVSVFQGDKLVDENLVNLSNSDKRKVHALVLSERFGIDQAEEKLLQMMQVVRAELEAAGTGNAKESQGTQMVKLAQEKGCQGVSMWRIDVGLR